jgi:N-formylglutamate amidohydrolase
MPSSSGIDDDRTYHVPAQPSYPTLIQGASMPSKTSSNIQAAGLVSSGKTENRSNSSPMLPILHIPHAGRQVPKAYQASYLGGIQTIQRETEILGDLWTDRLFISEATPSLPVVFPFSRIFVDVERFREDAEEIMATRGMGALYLNGHDLKPIRSELTDRERHTILSRFYDPHHAKLSKRVAEQLEWHGQALIIDCHSFPKDRLPYEDAGTHQRPEICIGTDTYHTPNELASAVLDTFLRRGYSVALNQPFAGSLVPLKYYGKDSRVRSIMIEVRRDLFLPRPGTKSKKKMPSVHQDIQNAIQAALKCIK